jgi:ketosteroid isomerase-like protein
MFQAFNRHDAGAVVNLMTEDCVFDAAAGPHLFGARYVGHAAIRAAFEQVWTTFPDVRWDEVRHFSFGDRAVSEWIFRATAKDGSRIEVQGCDLFTLRNNKVAVKNAFRKDRPVQKV